MKRLLKDKVAQDAQKRKANSQSLEGHSFFDDIYENCSLWSVASKEILRSCNGSHLYAFYSRESLYDSKEVALLPTLIALTNQIARLENTIILTYHIERRYPRIDEIE